MCYETFTKVCLFKFLVIGLCRMHLLLQIQRHGIDINTSTCFRAPAPNPPPKCIPPSELKTYSHSPHSHLAQWIWLELLHLEYSLVVYLYSSGEQPAVRNGENPSSEGGKGVKAGYYYCPFMSNECEPVWTGRIFHHWTPQSGEERIWVCYSKKWHT